MSRLTSTDNAVAYGRGLLTGRRVRLRPLHDSDLAVLEAWWGPVVDAVAARCRATRAAGASS